MSGAKLYQSFVSQDEYATSRETSRESVADAPVLRRLPTKRSAMRLMRAAAWTIGVTKVHLNNASKRIALAEEKAKSGNTLASDLHALKEALSENKLLALLLVFIPLGIIAGALKLDNSLVFIFNFMAIIPLAWLLGLATEELALRTNQTLGGLLNATFGNAVELIVSIVALLKHEIRLVQTSLLGSILSNMLLVLGMSFMAGGLKFKQQTFNRHGAQVFSSLLLMASFALVVPAAFFSSLSYEDSAAPEDVLRLSRGASLCILCVYGLYLYFQLKTHSHLFEDEDEEKEDPALSGPFAMFLQAAVTVCVAVCSEYLVDSIGGITEKWGINEVFVGIILLPIVGNAAEHYTAITVAMKDKMDLAIGVAIGSSIQIALFVIPSMVIIGWMIGGPTPEQEMNLNFQTFETIVLVVSVFIANSTVAGGQTHYLEGSLLVVAYIITAIAFYYHPRVE